MEGIRDNSRLEAAIFRLDYFNDPIQKAAAILQSIAHDHPFIDGNKRTGYVCMDLILNIHGIRLIATLEEKEELVLSAVKNESHAKLAIWISKHTTI